IQSIFRKAGDAPVGASLRDARDVLTLQDPADHTNSGSFSPGEKVGMRGTTGVIALHEPAEQLLAKRLCQFAETLPTVLNDFRPNLLANYLFELANSFHAFYEACPVLKVEEPARASRLTLCEITARVLQRGLDLLGIDVPERM
nr:hypothetical protein [Chthoniobacterales bacterium]